MGTNENWNRKMTQWNRHMNRLAENIAANNNRRNKDRGCINVDKWTGKKLRELTKSNITFEKLESLMQQFVEHRFSECRHSGEWAPERVAQQLIKLQRKIEKKIRKLDN